MPKDNAKKLMKIVEHIMILQEIVLVVILDFHLKLVNVSKVKFKEDALNLIRTGNV
jgi:hypothetical protein